MQDKSMGHHPPSVAYSKENSGPHWTSAAVLNFFKIHSLSSFFASRAVC